MLIERINSNLNAEQTLQMIGFNLDRIEQHGSVIRAFCPIHKDRFLRTLTIEPGQKKFRCSYSKCGGSRGGNLFDLFRLAEGLTEVQAAQRLADYFGIEVHGSLEEEPEHQVEEPIEVPEVPLEEQEPELEILTVPSDVESEDELAALVEDAVQGISQDFVHSEEEEEEDAEPKQLDLTLSEEIPGPAVDVSEQAYQSQAAGSNWETLCQAGMELFEENRYSQAESKLAEAFKAAPSDQEKAQVALVLGKCYLEGRRPSEAAVLLETVLKSNAIPKPLDKSLRKLLISVYEKKGDSAHVLELVKELAHRHGEDAEVTQKINQLEEAMNPGSKTSAKPKRISFL